MKKATAEELSREERDETLVKSCGREEYSHDSILLFRVFVVGCLPYNLDWHEISTNPLLKPTQQDFCKENPNVIVIDTAVSDCTRLCSRPTQIKKPVWSFL